MSPTLTLLSPHALALVAAVLALVADAFITLRAAVWFACAALASAGGLALIFGATVGPGEVGLGLAVGGAFSTAPGAVYLLAACALAGGAAALESRAQGGAAAALVALGALGAGLAASSVDVVTTFLAIEATALAGYALVALGRTRAAAEASLKYLIQGALAASLFVLGIAGTFGMTGSTLMDRIGSAARMGALPLVGGAVLLGVALSFKAGAFPFHTWVPDVYESSPPESTAFLSAGPKIAAVSALAFLSVTVGASQRGAGTAWIGVITAVAVGSIVFGNLAALRQRSYTRMLAYSGIAQAGYALVAVSSLSAASAIFAVVTYAVGACAAFLAATGFRRMRPGWDGSIAGLAGAGKSEPIFGAAVAVAMLSLVGIPPLLGFWGKFQAFGAAVATGQWWLALVGLLGSVVSFGYYGGVLRALYFDTADAEASEECRPGIAGATVVGLALAILALGVVPLVLGTRWIGVLFGT